MRFSTPSLAALLLAVAGQVNAQAQFLVSDMSFGYSGSPRQKQLLGMSTDDMNRLPGFTLLGNPEMPEILSNKIILTPPAPGNQRGAIWADKQTPYRSWTTDVDFRVSGGERGSGNLNIWLASEGSYRVSTSSIYTVQKWDGLAIVIDQHGGSGGMIRGFLNDGTIDYRSHQAVDSLAFGHCLFAYRNRGIPSQLKIRHGENEGLKVEIDGKLCFQTEKVRIPPGYNFGITSASAENPDSHEILKMVVMTDNLNNQNQGNDGDDSQQVVGDDEEEQQQEKPKKKKKSKSASGSKEKTQYGRSGMFQDNDNTGAVPDDPYDTEFDDENPDTITSSKAQFADLHNRLQSVNHHLSTIFRTVAKQGTIGEKRHEEASSQIHDIKKLLASLELLDQINNRLISVEKEVRMVKTDLGRQFRSNEQSLKGYLSNTQETLHQKVLDAAPGHGKLIMVIIGSQVVVMGAYIWHKRRKNSIPKKFL